MKTNKELRLSFDVHNYLPLILLERFATVKDLVILYIWVSLLDLLTTVSGRMLGLEEANPLMNLPISAFIAFKMTAVMAVCFLFLIRMSKGLAVYGVLVTAFVASWNLYGVCQIIFG